MYKSKIKILVLSIIVVYGSFANSADIWSKLSRRSKIVTAIGAIVAAGFIYTLFRDINIQLTNERESEPRNEPRNEQEILLVFDGMWDELKNKQFTSVISLIRGTRVSTDQIKNMIIDTIIQRGETGEFEGKKHSRIFLYDIDRLMISNNIKIFIDGNELKNTDEFDPTEIVEKHKSFLLKLNS